MSDLSRSLVDAAAEALPTDPCWPDDRETVTHWELVSTTPEARAEDINLPEVYGVPQWGPVEQVACRVVAAVLETLAAGVADQPVELADLTKQGQLYNSGKQYVIDLMRRLAAEVKTGGETA